MQQQRTATVLSTDLFCFEEYVQLSLKKYNFRHGSSRVASLRGDNLNDVRATAGGRGRDSTTDTAQRFRTPQQLRFWTSRERGIPLLTASNVTVNYN